MIRNIVMLKVKEECLGDVDKFVELLLGLKSKISCLQHIEVHKNTKPGERAMDFVLMTTFQNEEDLKGYLEHPAHVHVGGMIRAACIESKTVTHEVKT
ncbi:MAG: Dabb family protein [Algicola sp.]|nr:Dabb family protein [Algicola sp.]